MNTLFWLIIILVLLDFALSLVLNMLNIKASRLPIPDVLNGLYNEQEYARQQEYFRTNTRTDFASSFVNTAVTLAFFAFGGYALVDSWVVGITESPVLQALLFWAVIFLVSEICSLPISIYETFVVEEKFGFNKTTPWLFVTDLLKNLALDGLFLGGALALAVWLYTLTPVYFWLIAWAAVALFNFFMDYFYSELIVPLFNKQTPLEEGELRDAIENFAREVDFPLKNIYVIDSSRRSTHANAYFAGFGRKKRVVLYDTLIQQLSTGEIVGVLAHEIGHYKHSDTLKDLVFEFGTSLLTFWLFSLVIDSRVIAASAGCPEASFHVNLAVFSLIYIPLSLVIDIIGNIMSRRMERNADEFARSHSMGKFQSSGLKKMSAKSLSNLTPHPAVVFLEYSHPPLSERVAALEMDV